MFDASVIIPTFRRPRLVQAAVESVLSQRGLTVAIEIVVVDNDPERSAQQIVAALARSAPLAVRYVCEPRAGISHARNTGIAASGGRYIAFLDDDESAPPQWFASLWSTAREYGADIVVGPVRACFPKGVFVPDYAESIYNRDAKAETGQLIEWSGIGNALIRRDRCLTAPMPFDPRFGLSGGEDVVFLRHLREQGRRCVWCAEGAVSETIPAEKLRPAYLLRRAFRGGQTTAYLPSTLARPQWPLVLRWMAIGAAQVCVFGPWAIALRLFGRKEWLSAMAKAASGLGKLFWHPALHLRNYQLRFMHKSTSEAG